MDHHRHKPVLLREAMELLNLQPGSDYLDLTAGYGGHARVALELVGRNGSLTLVDRDDEATKHLKKTFKGQANVDILHSDFLSASRLLIGQGKKFDAILADLGASSHHFDSAERGFSIKKEGPLDMRMDRSQKIMAADLANEASEKKLARILREYGEVKSAHKLAKKIVQHRPYRTTSQLAEVIVRSLSARKQRIHPATQVFQALRIAINDELGQLNASLPLWVELLNSGGRLGVISFHSLEDRLVKQAMKNYGGKRYDATLQTVTARPVTASESETVFNPRARSAKLRVAQRK